MRRLALIALIACSHDPGPPHVRSKPQRDERAPLRHGGPLSPRLASYKIDAKLDVTRHVITASETLTWTNGGTTAVDTLPFHLYMNAFKNESSLFMRTSHGEMRRARAAEGGWGWIDVESVSVDGVGAYKLRYPDPTDQTVAELQLGRPIGPGEHVSIDFKFTEQLPEVFARTGYKGEFHMVGQWFPKIGVRVGAPGAERWECQPFHSNAEFFADFGNYDVTLTVPSTEAVAATGVLDSVSEPDGQTRRLTYKAEDVHDFAWMADPYMNVLKGEASVDGDKVEVRVYYRGAQRDFAPRHLEAAIATIEAMSKSYTPYPWSYMTVIDPPMDAMLGAGGMEYPTLVTTGGDSVYSRPGMHLPEYVTVHEVGHNWFQGMLASNEVEEAWLDEGVNEWADGKVMDELYGPRTSAVDWMGWQAEVYSLRRALAEDPTSLPSPIAAAAYAFADNDVYGTATYASTMRALRTLELTVGPTRFATAMHAYADTWKFKHPTGRDLFETLGKELGQNLDWYFAPVWHEVGGLAPSVRSQTCRPYHDPRGVFGEGQDKKIIGEQDAPDTGAWTCDVLIQNVGTIHVPIDVEFRFADGSSLRDVWDDRGSSGNWKRFSLQRSSKITEVLIDPDGKLQLDQPMQHHVRKEGDGAAALRAAAWVGSIAQTLMQAVGP